MPVNTTCPIRTWDTNGCGYNWARSGFGPKWGTYVNANNNSEIPTVNNNNRTGDLVRRRNGLTRNRSTTSPVANPTPTATMNASHQLQPQSSTHLANNNAD